MSIQIEHHVVHWDNGHEPSIDCWCEPLVELYRDERKRLCALVSHHDFSQFPAHRRTVVRLRDERPDWITRVLETFHA